MSDLLAFTGLDAAGPLWCGPTQVPIERRLEKSDAIFVQGIHTANSPINGCSTEYGTQDFYPNNGNPPQPGCTSLELNRNNLFICSHFKAIEYYRRSLNSSTKFEGCDFFEWIFGRCSNAKKKVRMGIYNTDYTPGKYYLSID